MKGLVVIAVICGIILSPFPAAALPVPSRVPTEVISPSPSLGADDGIETKAFRSGRRTYRAPTRSGNTGGVQSGTTRTQRPGTGTPVTRAPASRFGGFGGFFGGMLAGSLLGSLFNPFGYGGLGFGGFNLLAVLVWVVVIYAAFRLIRRMLVPRR